MVLMGIGSEMCKHQVRGVRFASFDEILNLSALEREVSVAKGADANRLAKGAAQKVPGAVSGLAFTCALAAEDDPLDIDSAVLRKELKHGAATADFDVVGVSSQTQNTQIAFCGRRKVLCHRCRDEAAKLPSVLFHSPQASRLPKGHDRQRTSPPNIADP